MSNMQQQLGNTGNMTKEGTFRLITACLMFGYDSDYSVA